MDPGWLVLFAFTLVEGILVILLVLPMPSNNHRRAITDFVAGLWEAKYVQYTAISMLVIDAFYFYHVMGALLHPFYDMGILSPVDVGLPCDLKAGMFRNERNAYISGSGLFLFFVLNRLVDIQDKLHQYRDIVKSTTSGDGSGDGAMKTGNGNNNNGSAATVSGTEQDQPLPSAPPLPLDGIVGATDKKMD